MSKKRYFRIVVSVLIFVFSLQLIPSTFFEDESFDYNTDDTKICLRSIQDNVSITLTRCKTRNPIIRLSYWINLQSFKRIHVSFLNAYALLDYGQSFRFDFRKKIECTESNQLHGSKSKNICIFI